MADDSKDSRKRCGLAEAAQKVNEEEGRRRRTHLQVDKDGRGTILEAPLKWSLGPSTTAKV